MTRSSPEVSARARRVWDRLQSWYGTRVAETYGPNPPRDWCRLIDRSNDLDVKRALATIRSRHPSHPPTLPEFEAALSPPPPVNRPSTAESTVQDRLVAYVMGNFTMSPRQMIAAWTWLYQKAQWKDDQNRQRNELATCVGVWIPGDGERAGFRVTVQDMAEAA